MEFQHQLYGKHMSLFFVGTRSTWMENDKKSHEQPVLACSSKLKQFSPEIHTLMKVFHESITNPVVWQ